MLGNRERKTIKTTVEGTLDLQVQHYENYDSKCKAAALSHTSSINWKKKNTMFM